MAKLPVSVCLLAFNEEDRLPRCLEKLVNFNDILVLDSGSTDRSLSICKKYGAQIMEHSWLGFGKMRRKLFSAATQPWILWLDADEVISDSLNEELQALFSQDQECEAYEINRMVFFNNRWIRHGDWFPDWNVRLFKRDCWDMDERMVHESLTITGKVGRLNGLLEHHTYRNWADQRKRAERYAYLWAEQHANHEKACGPVLGATKALWRFVRGYIVKLGFLDGILGFQIALACAREVALKYRLLRGRMAKK